MPQKRTKSHASKALPERRIPGWLWLLTGIVLGGFAMFLVHLSELKRKGFDPELSTTQSNKEARATTKSDSAATDAGAPEEPENKLIFEFYDRLKDQQVTVPEYEKPDPSTQKATHHHFLQVASFRRLEDADKARAKLILLNMSADIEESTLQSGATAYRVIVGPYTNKSKLAKARQTLVSNGFEFLTLKRKI